MTTTSRDQERLDTEQQARVFHALSDARRLRILAVLQSGERCVCDLQADVGLAQSLLSFHLKTLRDAGLVDVRRTGRWAHYSLARPALARAQQVLSKLQQVVGPAPEGCCGQEQSLLTIETVHSKEKSR
ncbi:MAG: metalloregulator ArsR/SmtB family transcription factor [Candidatus Nanopelagicales bacterium]|nr:metalloregulator ArsR/SmtB family transcription factor [Candidatus Nanopelagicales bacterium]